MAEQAALYNLLYNRLQFALTISFHYLFPQLTMGLALVLLYLRTRALVTRSERYTAIARFWTRIFAVTFAFGVATGITMEFQFGTNWASFSRFAGGVIGQTLAMEGIFAFALESTFLGIMLFGEKRFSPRVHLVATFMVFAGAWLSGYFIIATNAWMQHPVAYATGQNGVHLASFWGLLTNSHIFWQYLHNQTASVITASFFIVAVGAFYLLSNKHLDYARTFLRTGILTAAVFSILAVFPTGDGNAQMVFSQQPIKGAAMEGIFHTTDQAPMNVFGQPNMQTLTIDNRISIPGLTTLLLYRRLRGTVQGLLAFPRSDWPTNVPLVFYSYHVMINLGMLFVGIMLLALFLLWQRKLFGAHWMLWILMFSSPLPYVTTTAGWMTAEIGRQPWIVYNLLRTQDGVSPLVGSGNTLATLIGVVGLYATIGLLYVFLVLRQIGRGPAAVAPASGSPAPSVPSTDAQEEAA